MTTLFRSFLTYTGFAVAGALFVSGAAAQQNQGTPVGPAAPKGWFKLCDTDAKTKKQVCALNFSVNNSNGSAVASIRIVEIEGVPQKGFTIAVPPGLLIQPGMRIQIDGEKTGTAKFQICSPQACFVEARFEEDLIGKLKRGNEMQIIGIDQTGKQIGFPVTLSGFTAMYDGPPVDPATIAKNQETLQDRLQRKADEARQKLLEKGEGGEAAPAAPESGTAPKQ